VLTARGAHPSASVRRRRLGWKIVPDADDALERISVAVGWIRVPRVPVTESIVAVAHPRRIDG
jgi:hypothetical protein